MLEVAASYLKNYNTVDRSGIWTPAHCVTSRPSRRFICLPSYLGQETSLWSSSRTATCSNLLKVKACKCFARFGQTNYFIGVNLTLIDWSWTSSTKAVQDQFLKFFGLTREGNRTSFSYCEISSQW